MKPAIKTLLLLGLSFYFSCCKDGDSILMDDSTENQATVTFLITPNGLGDNGYNDDAIDGIFAFREKTGVKVKLLQPQDMEEAEQIYMNWLNLNVNADSSVLIVGSSAFEGILKRMPPFFAGRGSRVMLFESTEQIQGVSTVMVNRYGVSYLAGAMSKDFDSFILAGAPGFSVLEEAIAGFKAGHNDFNESNRSIELQYLAEEEEGFAMPDSAYHTIYRRSENNDKYDEIIFPLLGGSGTGITKFLNSDDLTQTLCIGMDVDQTGQSSRIPFSMVIHIGDVIYSYLQEWRSGKEWPATKLLGLSDGASDIAITPNFLSMIDIWDERYDDDDTFLNLYNNYYENAIRKEAEYVKK